LIIGKGFIVGLENFSRKKEKENQNLTKHNKTNQTKTKPNHTKPNQTKIMKQNQNKSKTKSK